MADIATGAGVSRTALYHYFPGKEEVLQALVEDLHARVLSEASEALQESRTLDEALTNLLNAKFGRTHVVISESPHGTELVDSTHRLTGPATRASDTAFHRLVVAALKRHGRAREADAVADTLIAAAKGLMRSGEGYVSKPVFARRIRRLVTWVTK